MRMRHDNSQPLKKNSNVDGASSDQDGSSSVGVVIRDSNGQTMAALCLPLQSHFSAELTEVFALEQGVLFAQEL